MFFGVAVRGWWALPLLAVLAVVWVLVQVFKLAAVLVVLLVQLIAPVLGASLMALLGRADACGVDRLETAAERHANGKERKQELIAQAQLRHARL